MRAHKRVVSPLMRIVAILTLACILLAALLAVTILRPDLTAWVLHRESPAVREARAGAAASPSDSQAWTALGFALQEAQDPQGAVACYDRALRLDAGNLGALYNRGKCFLAMGQEAAGERDLIAVLNASPVHALAAYDLADFYRRKGRYAELVKALKPAAEANPDMADLHAMLGLGYERTGEASRAVEEYQAALERDPASDLAAGGIERLAGKSR